LIIALRAQSETRRISRARGIVLVEEDTPPTQEVPAVANNLDSSLRVVAVQQVENLVV
jgi:hypothetical protein